MAKKRTREQQVSKNEDFAPNRGRDTSKKIPTDDLENFVGYVPNIYSIDAIYLGWDNRFRINVYCAHKKEGNLYDAYSIDKSYHVRYTNGEFEDKSNPVKKNSSNKYL